MAFLLSPNALPVVFPRPNCPSLLASPPARKSNHLWFCRLPFTLESALVPNYNRWAFCLCFSLQTNAFVLSKRRRKGCLRNSSLGEQSTGMLASGEVLRALSTGCCHLSASLKRYLANLISCPKNRPGSCSHSRQPCCLPREGEMHLRKLLPAGFLTTLTKKLSATGHGVLFTL